MKKLLEGFKEFHDGVYPGKKQLFESLAGGQSPRALFITCSDSRVDPSLITRTDPGELFVLRNAGNIVPAHGVLERGGELATIEYAVEALRIKNIIVCGHSRCGAMQGLLHPDTAQGLPHVLDWLEHAQATRAIVDEGFPEAGDDERLQHAVEANVVVQLNHLRTHPAVARKMQSGQLNLYGWVYDIRAGEITALNFENGRFEPLTEETIEHPFPSVPVR
ncbi:MAG: carbonic anhydrase [Myxococcota bacterium]|nr:carbonic anhydrase [Myxococcota bacterium]